MTVLGWDRQNLPVLGASTLELLLDLVRSYLGRALTFPDDNLAAIEGIFKAFERISIMKNSEQRDEVLPNSMIFGHPAVAFDYSLLVTILRLT